MAENVDVLLERMEGKINTINYKIDTIIERNSALEKKDTELETMILGLEKRVQTHGYYWATVWVILGYCSAVSVTITGKFIYDWISKKP